MPRPRSSSRIQPGHVVEEVPVVGDRDHRALVRLEEALEPGDATRRRGGSSARRGAAGRATRAAAGRARRVGARRPTASSRPGRRRAAASASMARSSAGVEPPRVVAVDLLLHLRLLGEERVEVGIGLGERGRDGVEAVEQVAQRPHAVLDVAAHVLRVVELRLLLRAGRRSRSDGARPRPTTALRARP